jgi:hypothetical protein
LVDFGVHVADNKTVYKTITVRNTGSTSAPYRIDYKGEHPIGFSPQSAVVQAHSSVAVEVILIRKVDFQWIEHNFLGVVVNIIAYVGR